MAYLGNGIYDLLDVVRASANPQINYEGLYQDASAPIATSNLLQAMQPGFEYRTPRFMERQFRRGADDLSGNISTDINRRIDFVNYFDKKPLRSNYESLARFENFNPRVSRPEQSIFYNAPEPTDTGMAVSNKLYNQPFNMFDVSGGIMDVAPTSLGFDTSYGVANEEDEEQVEYLPGQEPSGIGKLFEFLRNIPTPLNIARRGLGGLRQAYNNFRGSDFVQSDNLMEFIQRRRNRKAAEEMARRSAASNVPPIMRGGGGGNGGARSAPSGVYEQANKDFAASR